MNLTLKDAFPFSQQRISTPDIVIRSLFTSALQTAFG